MQEPGFRIQGGDCLPADCFRVVAYGGVAGKCDLRPGPVVQSKQLSASLRSRSCRDKTTSQ
jgi:hypothetical protein